MELPTHRSIKKSIVNLEKIRQVLMNENSADILDAKVDIYMMTYDEVYEIEAVGDSLTEFFKSHHHCKLVHQDFGVIIISFCQD